MSLCRFSDSSLESSPMNMLSDALLEQFLKVLRTSLQGNVLPGSVMELIRSFHQSLLVLRSVIPQLDVARIVRLLFGCALDGAMSECVDVREQRRGRSERFCFYEE